MNKKTLLLILDGWGIGKDDKVSAIAQANTPFMDDALKNYPNAQLRTDGLQVGLPEGQMGNSEVGHMNLGAGRVVYQNLVRINLAAENGDLKTNPVLQKAFTKAKEENKNIHLIGLVSDGGVHSHINHLKALLKASGEADLGAQTFVHAFTDGRDTDPKGGINYIKDLQQDLVDSGASLASICGRYYAMDRDKRWERVKLAYDALVHAKGAMTNDWESVIQESYNQGVTDEFLKPIILQKEGNAVAKIQEGDIVLCFNFRTDRGRQITMALTQQNFPAQSMSKLDLHYLTLTNYDDTFKNVEVLFEETDISKTLGEVLSKAGKSQVRIAETEKYPHVTFFFNGGREEPFGGEKRILCPSPKEVATYDLKPEMSANEIRDKIVPEIKTNQPDFICLNFANPDMVGHTGVFEAAVKACETVDCCAKAVVDAALEKDYAVLIIADHGNADVMINSDGSPNTQHSTNPVPFILLGTDNSEVKSGKLGDIAPTILTLMGVEIPEEMDGDVLIA